MNLPNFKIKNFCKKGILIPLFSVVLTLGSLGNRTQKETEKTSEEEIPIVSLLPEGKTKEEKFRDSLKKTTGVEGQLNLSLKIRDRGASDSYSFVETKNASLRLSRPDQNTFGFDLNADISYNDVSKGVHINYADEVAYMNLAGLTYKYSDTTYKGFIGKIISIFGVDIIKVPDSVYDFMDILFKKDSNETEIAFEEEKSSSPYAYRIDLGNRNFIHLEEDSNYNLSKIYANELTFGESILSFCFDTTRNDDELTVIKSLKPSNEASYKEVYDSLDLVRKIHDLVKSPKFDVSLKGTLHHEVEENNHHTASEEDISLNSNLSFDIPSKIYAGEITAFPDGLKETPNRISFLTRQEEEQKIYLNYNDVMKIGLSDSMLNDFLGRVKADFGTGFDLLDKVLSLLDENFLSSFRKGRYESFLGMINSLTNEDNMLKVSLHLGGFGLGDDSRLDLEINANGNLATISMDNVGLQGFTFEDTTITITDYHAPSFNTEGYYFVDKIPDIYSQLYNIYSAPKFHLALEGSYTDSNGVGLSEIKGEANLLGHSSKDALYTFDGGYLDLKLSQQIGINNSDGSFSKFGDKKNHHISLDLEKLETAYFHYYDEDLLAGKNKEVGTYGKMSIGPFEDIVDIVKSIYKSNDPRFSKWFQVIAGAASSNVIDALKTGRYSPLLGTNLVVSSSFATDSSKIVLSGKAFGFNDEKNNNDFSISLQYENNKVKTLSLENLVIGEKTLNLSITLSEYDPSKTSIVDRASVKMDFTGLAPLISDLYNTANLKTYHLTAQDIGLNIKVLSFIKVKLDLDFHIFVDGNIVKVYGKINTPISFLYTEDFEAFYSYRNCIFYFDDIDPNTGKAYENNSGYAYLSYGLAKNKTTFSEETKGGHYRYHSSYFQDTESVLHFLFRDIIDIKTSYYKKIVNAINKEDTTGKAINYEKLISSFSYDESNREWNVGIAIEVLLNNDTLKDMKVKIASAYSNANNCYILSQFDISLTLASIIDMSGTVKNIDLDKKDNWSEVNDLYASYIQAHLNDQVDYPSGYVA